MSTRVRFGKRAASSFSAGSLPGCDAERADVARREIRRAARGGAMTKKFTFIESQRSLRSEVMRALKRLAADAEGELVAELPAQALGDALLDRELRRRASNQRPAASALCAGQRVHVGEVELALDQALRALLGVIGLAHRLAVHRHEAAAHHRIELRRRDACARRRTPARPAAGRAARRGGSGSAHRAAPLRRQASTRSLRVKVSSSTAVSPSARLATCTALPRAWRRRLARP